MNEKSKYDIANVIVKVKIISPTETVTDTLGQTIYATKELADDNADSISINVYGELSNILEENKIYNLAFSQIHNFN